jgi:ABC-2 type transport system permease protein
VSSALLVVPTPAPGDSPFKRVPGSTFTMFLAFFLCWALVAVLALPAVIPAVMAVFFGVTGAGWVSLAIGLLWGAIVFAGGVFIGGKRFDAGAPTLLAQLRAFQGA